MKDASSLDYQFFEVGNLALQSGLTYRDAKLAYKTYGTLNAERRKAILLRMPPTTPISITWLSPVLRLI